MTILYEDRDEYFAYLKKRNSDEVFTEQDDFIYDSWKDALEIEK